MWQLLNFIIGEAKMAIYLSRRNKVEGTNGTDAITLWRRNVHCRLQLKFYFFKAMIDFKSFGTIWCYENTLCKILNYELYFNVNLFSSFFCFFFYIIVSLIS